MLDAWSQVRLPNYYQLWVFTVRALQTLLIVRSLIYTYADYTDCLLSIAIMEKRMLPVSCSRYIVPTFPGTLDKLHFHASIVTLYHISVWVHFTGIFCLTKTSCRIEHSYQCGTTSDTCMREISEKQLSLSFRSYPRSFPQPSTDQKPYQAAGLCIPF